MKTYRNLDTGESWTEEEIKKEFFDSEDLVEKYADFQEYLEYLLDLGRDSIGGIVEED